ncbi:MAG TPA: hypothetical protein VMR41_00130 [Patescibacteria group bacterium]|nr:hypothetical protein [Patescibacteria group bacterium]
MQSIPGKNYRYIRWKLLTKSLALTIIVEQLRKLCDIPSAGKKLKDKSLNSRFAATRRLEIKIGENKLKIINNVADSLLIERSQFENYILFNIIDNPFIHGLRLIFKDKPLDEPGVYLKIDSFTTEDELGKAYKHVRRFIKDTIAPIIYNTQMRKKSTGLDTNESIFYNKSESKIKEYYQGKKLAIQETEETYKSIVHYAMYDLAGEETSEKLPPDMWDKEVKKKREQLRMKYYAITERYGLPTLTDLSKLLQLILNN